MARQPTGGPPGTRLHLPPEVALHIIKLAGEDDANRADSDRDSDRVTVALAGITPETHSMLADKATLSRLALEQHRDVPNRVQKALVSVGQMADETLRARALILLTNQAADLSVRDDSDTGIYMPFVDHHDMSEAQKAGLLSKIDAERKKLPMDLQAEPLAAMIRASATSEAYGAVHQACVADIEKLPAHEQWQPLGALITAATPGGTSAVQADDRMFENLWKKATALPAAHRGDTLAKFAPWSDAWRLITHPDDDARRIFSRLCGQIPRLSGHQQMQVVVAVADVIGQSETARRDVRMERQALNGLLAKIDDADYTPTDKDRLFMLRVLGGPAGTPQARQLFNDKLASLDEALPKDAAHSLSALSWAVPALPLQDQGVALETLLDRFATLPDKALREKVLDVRDGVYSRVYSAVHVLSGLQHDHRVIRDGNGPQAFSQIPAGPLRDRLVEKLTALEARAGIESA